MKVYTARPPRFGDIRRHVEGSTACGSQRLDLDARCLMFSLVALCCLPPPLSEPRPLSVAGLQLPHAIRRGGVQAWLEDGEPGGEQTSKTPVWCAQSTRGRARPHSGSLDDTAGLGIGGGGKNYKGEDLV